MAEKNQRKEIMQALETWGEAVKSKDPGKVTELYAEDGILWGTVSPIIRPGHDLIRDYFVSFLAKENIRGEFTDQNIRIYGDIAINSGSYTFKWIENGRNIEADARFSFVYRNIDGKWMIVDHHSSFVPE